MRSVLLLNSTEEVLNFISEKKAFKLLYKGKVDIVRGWLDRTLYFLGQVIHYPAVIKLKYYVYRKFNKLIFSRRAIFKRDGYACQYCQQKLKHGQITVDHILPKSRGGKSCFSNCVAACYSCNKRKSNKMLSETNLRLIRVPAEPSGPVFFTEGEWHPDWDHFINKNGSNW